MQIIKFNGDLKIAKQLCDALLNGYILIMNTDTQWGLVSLFPESLYHIKQRSFSKPLISLITKDYKFDNLNYLQNEFLNNFWPGAMTAIIDGVSYRRTNAQYLNQIIDMLDMNVLCTSANISGEPPITCLAQAEKQFGGSYTKLIFVESDTMSREKSSPASTIVDINTWTIIRKAKNYNEILNFIKTKV